jgi:hypothetical protein
MSDEWKKQDRPCPPCPHCGVELYEKFWGNGGWAPTDKGTDFAHGNCIKTVSDRLKRNTTKLTLIRRLYKNWDNRSIPAEDAIRMVGDVLDETADV